MSAPAYMLSLLARQRQLLGEGFAARYPSAWLVWEPGLWRPARSVEGSNTEATQLPSKSTVPRPAGEDALCFELRGVPPAISVGRGTENHVVINDLTVSREQFLLLFAEHQWRVSTGNPATIDGRAIDARGAPLQDGSIIAVGDVRMTFYPSAGLVRRLDAMAARRPAKLPNPLRLQR